LQVQGNALIDVNESALSGSPAVPWKIKGVYIYALLVELGD
jgi:hypothetical protein